MFYKKGFGKFIIFPEENYIFYVIFLEQKFQKNILNNIYKILRL